MKQTLFIQGSIPAQGTIFFTLSPRAAAGVLENERKDRIAAAGTLRNLQIDRNVAVDASVSQVFTVRKNGADTAITCTITAGNTSAEDLTNEVTVAAGDEITIGLTHPLGSLAAAAFGQIRLEFEADDEATTIYPFGHHSSVNQFTNEYCPLLGGDFSGNNTAASSIASVAGTITDYYLRLSVAPGAAASGRSYLFTIFKNGTAQDGTGGTPDTRCTISETAVTGEATGFSLDVAAGDLLMLQADPTGAAATTTPHGTVAFVADTDGDRHVTFSSIATLESSATEYNQAHGGIGVVEWSGTEANHYHRGAVESLTLGQMYASVSVAPGSGKSWTFTLRKNGADTALTVTISDSETEATFAGDDTVTIEDGDTWAIEATPSGSPTVNTTAKVTFFQTQATPINRANLLLGRTHTLTAPVHDSFVTGATGTLSNCHRVVLLSLDDAANAVSDRDGALIVYGDVEIHGSVTFDGEITGSVSAAEVAISSADILALRATPIELVAAPGAGKLLEFVSAVLLLDATATAYVEGGDNLAVRYTGTTGAQVSETIEATGFIDQTSDTMTTGRATLDAIVAKTGCENQALVLHNIGAAEYTTGTGTLRVKVSYRVHSTGW